MSTLVQSTTTGEASFRQHYPRQQNQQQQMSYAAVVPMEESEYPTLPGTTQPTVYKQINVIPGLDADNAVVDTGIKLVRATAGQVQVSANTTAANEFDGKRMRRSIQRRTVDYNASAIQMLKHRLYKKSLGQKPVIHPDPLYYVDIVQPRTILQNPINSVTTRFVRASTNKIRCPVFTVAWTPEGRRVVTGTSSGEFTLWNGLTFNFETILQAHESAVRAMEWSHNDMWLLSGDHNGVIKYWQSNMNNVKMIQAHTDPIRGLSFCPTDNKFVTCSDDGLLKVWDFYRCQEETVLRGHGADVKCCGWHPSKSLIASGSKDSQQPLKLWDPRSGTSLATIHGHKSTVMDLQWNKNGNWILTGSRDRLLKVYDIRVMKDMCTFRGHKKEAASVNWHPLYEEMFASGGSDGSIMFWLMGCEKELGVMDCAHDGMIWDLKWHPLGHILCSGSNDHTTKFWTRNRPADKMRDKYNLNVLPTGFEDDYEYELPDCSQSDGNPVVPIISSSSVEIPIKGKTDNTCPKKSLKSDLDIPAVKALIEQASLEVSKPDSSDAPAQVYTLSQLRPTAPAFKIDSTKQQQALDEVERLEKRRERQLRKGIDKGQKRPANSDDEDTCNAPSLLDLDIAPPAFLQEQQRQEQKEIAYMNEVKQRQLQCEMQPARGQGPTSPRGTMQLPNWPRNQNEMMRPRPENEMGNFEASVRPPFHGMRPEGVVPNFDNRPQGAAPPRFDRPNDRPPQVGAPMFDRQSHGGPADFNRPPQDARQTFDRPPSSGASNFDRPLPNGQDNFNRPPQGGPPAAGIRFTGPADTGYVEVPRTVEHFDNRPRPIENFADRPRPPAGEFMNVPEFPDRTREEELKVPRTGPEFPNRPRTDEVIRDGPPGPPAEFDNRQRPKESLLPQRLGGDFDLRPLPSPPEGFDKSRPLQDNFHRPVNNDEPRFERERPHTGAIDGGSPRNVGGPPPPRSHNEEQRPHQFNEPRFAGPPIENRGPPSGQPRHNTPFVGPQNGPPRNDDRFVAQNNFQQQERWGGDGRIGDRWQDERIIPNIRPNDTNDRDGVNRENRERLR